MENRTHWSRTTAKCLSRRQFIGVAGLGASAIVLGSGCTSESPAASTALPASGSPGPQQAVRGGTLSIAQAADITPKTAVNAASPVNAYLLRGVFDTLMRYRTERLEVIPELAESLKFSPDYRSLTVKLRPGVKYHTGRPLTSRDIKWNIERLQNPVSASQMMNMAKWVQKIDTPDDLTLNLSLDQPRNSFLDMFEAMYVADPETYEDLLSGKRVIGTGPFLFRDWSPGDQFSLKRNPDYWRKDLPYLDEVVVRVLPEAATRLINLQTGNVDVALGLEPRDIKEMAKDPKYAALTNPVMTGVWYLGIDMKAPGFGDKRVRQAMAHLIDRKRIVDTLLLYGEPTNLPWDNTSPAYTADSVGKLEYNPNRAKELLSQAGIASGTSVSIIPSPSYVQTPQMAELFHGELVKVGWKPSLEKIQAAEYLDKWGKGQFNGIWFSLVGNMHMTPSTLFVMTIPFRVPNASNFDTPEYRKLLDDILNVTDENTLKSLYKRINDFWLDECFVIPIASSEQPSMMTAKIKGVTLARGGQPILSQWWKQR